MSWRRMQLWASRAARGSEVLLLRPVRVRNRLPMRWRGIDRRLRRAEGRRRSTLRVSPPVSFVRGRAVASLRDRQRLTRRAQLTSTCASTAEQALSRDNERLEAEIARLQAESLALRQQLSSHQHQAGCGLHPTIGHDSTSS